MMAYLHTYLSSPPPPVDPYCGDFYVTMLWTYQMKERLLMQQASFELKCSILMSFFVFNGNTSVDVGWFLEVPFLLSYWSAFLSRFLQFYQLGPNEV